MRRKENGLEEARKTPILCMGNKSHHLKQVARKQNLKGETGFSSNCSKKEVNGTFNEDV